MQTIKNMLHSDKHEDNHNNTTSPTSSSNTGVGNNTSNYTGVGANRGTDQPGYGQQSGIAQRDRELQSVGGDRVSSGTNHGSSTDNYNNQSAHIGGHHNTGSSGLGSTTGDSSRTSPTSGSGYNSNSTPTNASATHSTGLTGSSSSDNYNTGAGRSTAGTSHLDHTSGHDHSAAAKFDPSARDVTHDHKHLNHVTHRDVRHTEVEEVERQREIERNIHHVQHHVQPIVDKQVKPEQVRENIVPVTNINEKHASTDQDRQLFQGLASQYRDTETHRGKERTVVDLGEKVHENVHHHVHHVTQPVVEQEVIDRTRIHTVIPVHETTHEAPIIHKSSTHEPVSMDSFLQGGGKLGSGIDARNSGVLTTEGCDRKVDGVAEKLIGDLHLGGSSSSSRGYGGSSTGAAGAGAGLMAGRKHRHRSTTHRDGRSRSGRNNYSSDSSSSSSSDDERGGRTSRREKKQYASRDGDVHKSKIGAKMDDMKNSRSNNNNANPATGYNANNY